MNVSAIAAAVLIAPTAVVLVVVAVTARRDRVRDRAVAAVLAEFRTAAAAAAETDLTPPSPPSPPSPPDGGEPVAEEAGEPEQWAKVIPFPQGRRRAA